MADLEHEEVEPLDTDGEPKDNDPSDKETPEDGKSNRTKEEVAKAQEDSWAEDIKSGKKKIEDMPENLGWLRKRVEERLNPKPAVDPDKEKIREVLEERESERDFNSLVDALGGMGLSDEKEAKLRSEYEDLLADHSDPSPALRLKYLKKAMGYAGIADEATNAAIRRRKGLALPPLGTKSRVGPKPDKLNERQKKFNNSLPEQFKPKA